MKSLTIILSLADWARLRAIAGVHPLVSDHRIAQLSLRHGLRAIEEHPPRLVDEARVIDVPAEEGVGR